MPTLFEKRNVFGVLLLIFLYYLRGRYFFPFISTSSDPVFLKWDDDEGSALEMTILLYRLDLFFGLQLVSIATSVSVRCQFPYTKQNCECKSCVRIW